MARRLATIALLAAAAAVGAAAARGDAAGFDFGDAPDGSKAGYVQKPDVVARFPSKASGSGPRHGSAGPRLGTGWSAEGDSRQIDRDADDGAVLTQPRSCALSTINVVLDLSRVPDGTPVYVNAWFDWNQDGDWADGGGARCGPEWGVQNHRVDRTKLGGDVDVLAIRFRAGRVPEEFWWRVQVHVGTPAPHEAGAGVVSAGGETEDYLFSAAETAPELRLICQGSVIPHGRYGHGGWPYVTLHIVAPRGSGARLTRAHVRALGETDGVKVYWKRFFTHVEVELRATEHEREPLLQRFHLDVSASVQWRGGKAVARGSCPIVVRHAPGIPSETAHQGQRGPARVSIAVDPIRPDPAQAGCSADFFSDPAGARVGVRCQGIDPKLLTVATTAGIASLGGTAGTGSCSFGSDRHWVSCVVPKGRQGKLVGYLVIGTDRRVGGITIFVTAGGYSERGTTHVLRQDWWVTDRGYLCSQTVPRVERQRCATITAKPRLVDDPPTTTVPG